MVDENKRHLIVLLKARYFSFKFYLADYQEFRILL